jgi:hypothetical protein
MGVSVVRRESSGETFPRSAGHSINRETPESTVQHFKAIRYDKSHPKKGLKRILMQIQTHLNPRKETTHTHTHTYTHESTHKNQHKQTKTRTNTSHVHTHTTHLHTHTHTLDPLFEHSSHTLLYVLCTNVNGAESYDHRRLRRYIYASLTVKHAEHTKLVIVGISGWANRTVRETSCAC